MVTDEQTGGQDRARKAIADSQEASARLDILIAQNRATLRALYSEPDYYTERLKEVFRGVRNG